MTTDAEMASLDTDIRVDALDLEVAPEASRSAFCEPASEVKMSP